jgi:hypothetical protein
MKLAVTLITVDQQLIQEALANPVTVNVDVNNPDQSTNYEKFGLQYIKHKRGKSVRVTGRGCPYSCEASRMPHCLDHPLTDGGEIVSLTRRPPVYLQVDS